MIKNTHKALMDYAEAYKQANDVYKQAVAHIKANYKEGSELYRSAMKTANETRNNAVTPMKDMCRDVVKQDFAKVREAVQKAVTVAPTSELLAILPMVQAGKLNEAELQMFVDRYKGNYMDSKLLADAMGEHFTTVESILNDLEALEAPVNKFFDNYGNETDAGEEYMSRLMQKGTWIEEVDALTDDFVTTYGLQEGGEE